MQKYLYNPRRYFIIEVSQTTKNMVGWDLTIRNSGRINLSGIFYLGGMKNDMDKT